MNKFYLGSAAILILALYGCDEGKDTTISNKDKTIVSNGSTVSDVPALKILTWGPKATTLGKPFNVQPDGQSAFWFNMEGNIKPDTKLELWFSDTKLSDVVLNSKMQSSSYLPAKLLDKAGDYPIYLIHAPSKNRFDIGIFKITPAPVVESKASTDVVPVVEMKKSVKNKAKINN
jgi:hypothetical protein